MGDYEGEVPFYKGFTPIGIVEKEVDDHDKIRVFWA
jgi:hypothetical protein